MAEFIEYSSDDASKYKVAERFVDWIENCCIEDARGDEKDFSAVNPNGRFWLGRLGPKDDVVLPDERGDRLEPCAIGFRLKPKAPSNLNFQVSVSFCLWKREPADEGPQRWQWRKQGPFEVDVLDISPEGEGEFSFGGDEIQNALSASKISGMDAEIRVRVSKDSKDETIVEVLFVNISQVVSECSDGRMFECQMSLKGLATRPFILEALPDSFRYNREVAAFGINCGFVEENYTFTTTDGSAFSKSRPVYWSQKTECPDFSFEALAKDPTSSTSLLLDHYAAWAEAAWSTAELQSRAEAEGWTAEMLCEAEVAKSEVQEELDRIQRGCELLAVNLDVRKAFVAMNKSMALLAESRGYNEWRPFQLAFILANLACLPDPESENEVVDVVWFATGGGKTETYLGLLLTAAFFDRLQGKLSGITAWSRFPLRLLSLQQTQRFIDALAAGETIRNRLGIPGEPFSLGFLVGGGATPNRITKDDVDSLEGNEYRYRLIESCPFCKAHSVSCEFNSASWRFLHICKNESCDYFEQPLPLYVVDDEVWRFLPTVVIGTLDKAANIARHTGMRGIVGHPWGQCTKPGHGYTYAPRSKFPNGCLVPDCPGGQPGSLPMDSKKFAPSFRLQDELHLLRDSLGAVDAHYEGILDFLQAELSGKKPKILASSATLSGYEKQIDVLYQRDARVFPQLPPRDGEGFWTANSEDLMRRYVALAPRRLTVEFVVDRLVISLQSAIRKLINASDEVCSALNVSPQFTEFLVNLYGTNVIYGNTLQDIDAVLRSSETQYSDLEPSLNIAALVGQTNFEDVRAILNRLENPENNFEDRLHLIAASSMMSHGVDIERLNVMVMLAFPLSVAEFIQATARVGRRWPSIVIVVPKISRARDASVYRNFPEFVSHGDRFVEPIPITRKSRRVLERTLSGIELSRLWMIHEPESESRLSTIRGVNTFSKASPDFLEQDLKAVAEALGIEATDEFLIQELSQWFNGFKRNLKEPPADAVFPEQASPSGKAMTSLRDVEEQAWVRGDDRR